MVVFDVFLLNQSAILQPFFIVDKSKRHEMLVFDISVFGIVGPLWLAVNYTATFLSSKVKVNNMEYQVGRVEYDVPETFSFPMEAIAGIAAGGGFLLLVIVLILIIYRRQSTRAERIYHKLQIQLDNLESNVRNECKQGGWWWTAHCDFIVLKPVVRLLQVNL